MSQVRLPAGNGLHEGVTANQPLQATAKSGPRLSAGVRR